MPVLWSYGRKTHLSPAEVDEFISKIPPNVNPIFYLMNESSALNKYDVLSARLQIIQVLLERNPALAHSTNAMGDTPLTLAKESGQTALINLLTDIGNKQNRPSML